METLELEKIISDNSSVAENYYKNSNYDLAIPHYLKLLDAVKKNDTQNKLAGNVAVKLDMIYARLGECYLNINDNVSAINYFTEGMKINSTNPFLLVGAANVAFNNKQYDYAKKVLQFALAHNPTEITINDFIKQIDYVIAKENKDKENNSFGFNNKYYSHIPIEASKTTIVNVNPNNLLSLCMIVKNEEKMLAGCLESVKNIVDEIIIVDTGSTDKTLEIANKYGAKIYYFEWINDFSEARNESIKHSTSQWILYLDADERLTTESQNAIRTLINTANEEVGAYYVVIESDHRQLDGSTESHKGAYPRLFRNLGYPNIKFMGRVHEQISPSIVAMKKLTLPSDLVIEHLGYNLTEQEMGKKVDRNYKLLLEHVKDEPTNGYAWFQLGQTLGRMELFKEAEDATRFAIKCGDLKGAVLASATASLSQFCGKKKEFTEALYWAEETLKIVPKQLYGLSLKAHSLLYLGRKKEAEQAFLIALEYAKNIEKLPKSGFDIVISEKLLTDGLKKSRE
ncbi:MAG: glycosyltransferase family 2 protein [Bacteroidetes bacterium]|nr:glycosyltransferase family 2 protein [Bacteroidota bacterium]